VRGHDNRRPPPAASSAAAKAAPVLRLSARAPSPSRQSEFDVAADVARTGSADQWRIRSAGGPAQVEPEFIVEPIVEVVVDVHTYRTSGSPELTTRLQDSSTQPLQVVTQPGFCGRQTRRDRALRDPQRRRDLPACIPMDVSKDDHSRLSRWESTHSSSSSEEYVGSTNWPAVGRPSRRTVSPRERRLSRRWYDLAVLMAIRSNQASAGASGCQRGHALYARTNASRRHSSAAVGPEGCPPGFGAPARSCHDRGGRNRCASRRGSSSRPCCAQRIAALRAQKAPSAFRCRLATEAR